MKFILMTFKRFWNKNVGSKQEVKNGYFGASTKAINGALECNGGLYEDKARIRFEIYKNVLKAFNLNEVANEKGCYKC